MNKPLFIHMGVLLPGFGEDLSLLEGNTPILTNKKILIRGQHHKTILNFSQGIRTRTALVSPFARERKRRRQELGLLATPGGDAGDLAL